MSVFKKLIIKIIIIIITSLCSGFIALILASQLGIMDPDIWYNDPVLVPLLGSMVGVLIGWYLSNILIKNC